MGLCRISLQSTGRHQALTSPSPVLGQTKWERNEMSSYCSSSLACQTCGWKKLLVPFYAIRARLFSRPMMLSLLWWYFPWLVVGVSRGEGWDSTGEPDSTHAWSSRLGGKLWDDQIYSSWWFVLLWGQQRARQLLYFQGRGNLAWLGFVVKWLDFILCLCTSPNQISMLVQKQPSRKALIFLPIPLHLSPGFTKIVRIFFFLCLGPVLLSL